MSNHSAFRVVVYGLVQGVNYRYFVQRNAQSMGLTGYTRNLDDGSVEVFAEGEKEKLAQLIAKLRWDRWRHVLRGWMWSGWSTAASIVSSTLCFS